MSLTVSYGTRSSYLSLINQSPLGSCAVCIVPQISRVLWSIAKSEGQRKETPRHLMVLMMTDQQIDLKVALRHEYPNY